ncbi:MAG TPA: biopolymer transporter ExbD [Candidatus Kapabacteria bacterium]|nr:biopolymer transporter ExbD [Candidatus Kapabacteria bacterium]
MENVYGNQMHLLRKMDYKGFMASLCGVLLPVVLIYFINGPCDFCPRLRITLFEVKNYQYVPKDILTIEIPKDGGVQIDCSKIRDDYLSKLDLFIEDKFEANGERDVRIGLKADQSVPFGKIVQVLQVLPRAGIKSVFLVTDGYAHTMIEFIANKKFPNEPEPE